MKNLFKSLMSLMIAFFTILNLNGSQNQLNEKQFSEKKPIIIKDDHEISSKVYTLIIEGDNKETNEKINDALNKYLHPDKNNDLGTSIEVFLQTASQLKEAYQEVYVDKNPYVYVGKSYGRTVELRSLINTMDIKSGSPAATIEKNKIQIRLRNFTGSRDNGYQDEFATQIFIRLENDEYGGFYYAIFPSFTNRLIYTLENGKFKFLSHTALLISSATAKDMWYYKMVLEDEVLAGGFTKIEIEKHYQEYLAKHGPIKYEQYKQNLKKDEPVAPYEEWIKNVNREKDRILSKEEYFRHITAV